MAASKINRRAFVIEPDHEQVENVPLRRKITPIGSSDEPDMIRRSRIRQSIAMIQKTLTDGALSFITLKVILWDIVISVADISSDFTQGYTLYNLPGKRQYGIASLAINWIPGLALFIHVISMYRNQIRSYKVILYALLLLVFYPIVPPLVYIYLLYKKPKAGGESVSKEFVQAQYFATIVQAMTGGLESPIQLIFQIWLVVNGVIVVEWNQLANWTFTDPEVRVFYL